MRAARIDVPRSDLPLMAVGLALTALFVFAASAVGGTLSLGLVTGIALFFGVIAAFMVAPHVAVACTIPLFAVLPALKVLAFPWLGPAKDLVTIAAICAAVILVIQRSSQGQPQRADFWIVVCVAALGTFYILNAGGLEWDLAWAHGVRLVLEPLLLLLVGMTLDQPRRVLHWSMVSLVATAMFVAAVGILQQPLGMGRLYGYGYLFDYHLRTFHGQLRSFGTLDEPFAYAAFLLLAVAALVMWFRLGIVTLVAAATILAGLAFSFVRTAIIILLALLALWLARRSYAAMSIFLLGAATTLAFAVLIVSSNTTESRTVRTGSSTFLTINGRTESWRIFLGDPDVWVLGHGVGEVGTAADRATYTISQDEDDIDEQGRAVDSGYFAVIADVGLLGLIALLAILGRVVGLAARYARMGSGAAWLALALSAVLLIDAVTRASFTGFPTAFLAMLLIGVALGAAMDDASAAEARPRRSRAPR
jgi:hypothetical protein